MSKKPTIKAQPATQGIELEAPFNGSHPSSKCPKRLAPISGVMLRHKFKTTAKTPLRPGVFTVVLTCQHCQGFIKGIEDYTVTVGIF